MEQMLFLCPKASFEQNLFKFGAKGSSLGSFSALSFSKSEMSGFISMCPCSAAVNSQSRPI
jgi:hypothetical protein